LGCSHWGVVAEAMLETMDYGPKTYIMNPKRVRELNSYDVSLLGLMKNFTYLAAEALCKQKFKKGLLVCTIEYNKSFDKFPRLLREDTCYPISEEEWELFLKQENDYTRTPMEIWAVDGSKYHAPI